MKLLLFEEFKIPSDDIDHDEWVYSDEFLKIHKILHGENKGKIQFIFFNIDAFDEKYSMMYGVAKLLDTKYANLPEIRGITIGPIKFRKVPENTMVSIINLFIEKIDFTDYNNDDDKDKFLIKRILSSATILKFNDEIKEIALRSQDLGDIFDKLKIISDEIYDYQKNIYEKMKLELDINKFNL